MQRDLEQYETEYEAAPFEGIQAEYRRQLVLKQISKISPNRLIEIGCGTKPLFLDLPGEMNVTVVEPSTAFAQNARNLAINLSNVTVVEGYVEDQDLEPVYDMVVLSSVLHEVQHPNLLLKAVRRLCHKGTITHVNVPNAASMHRQLALAMGLITSVDALSETQLKFQQATPAFSHESLQKTLKDGGFTITESGGIFVKPFTHAQMQHLVDIEFLTDTLLQGFQKLSEAMPELASEIWMHVRKHDD